MYYRYLLTFGLIKQPCKPVERQRYTNYYMYEKLYRQYTMYINVHGNTDDQVSEE